MADKIRFFPINTSDQWSNEDIQGLCSPLCADIAEFGTYTSGSWYQDNSGNILSGLDLISGIPYNISDAISGYWGTIPSMTGDFISGYYSPGADYPYGNYVSGIDITQTLTYTTSGSYDIAPSTGYVVSEYGIKKAINDQINGLVSGENIGSGEGDFVDISNNTVSLKSIYTQYPNRFNFLLDPVSGIININYDGRGGSSFTQVSSFYVQGGNQQMWANIDKFETEFLSPHGINYNYGWVIGGYGSGSKLTSIEELVFSTETFNAPNASELSTGDYLQGVVFNNISFWSGDGRSTNIYFEKLTFANKTVTPTTISPGANLSTVFTGSFNDIDLIFGYTYNAQRTTKINMANDTLDTAGLGGSAKMGTYFRGGGGRDTSNNGYNVGKSTSKKFDMSSITWSDLTTNGTWRLWNNQNSSVYDDVKIWISQYSTSVLNKACDIYVYATNTVSARSGLLADDTGGVNVGDTRSKCQVRSGTQAKGLYSYSTGGELRETLTLKYSLTTDTEAGTRVTTANLTTGREDTPGAAMSNIG